MRKRNCQSTAGLTLALAGGLLLGVPAARANTLTAGDSLSVSLVCYDNAACSGYTAGSPLVSAFSPFVVPVPGSAGFSISTAFLDQDNFSEDLIGSFTNTISSNVLLPETFTIVLSPEDANGNLINFSSGGFVGLYITATTATSQPLAISFSGTDTGTTDGFTLANNLSFISPGVAALNFAGLTGTLSTPPSVTNNDTAVLDISQVSPIAAVPEPVPALLLATGLLAFLGFAWRKRQPSLH